MKNKDKKKPASKRKKTKNKKIQWFDKKKRIGIRKNALKKIYDHFKDQEKNND